MDSPENCYAFHLQSSSGMVSRKQRLHHTSARAKHSLEDVHSIPAPPGEATQWHMLTQKANCKSLPYFTKDTKKLLDVDLCLPPT